MLRQPSTSASAHRQALLAERAYAMRQQLTPSEAALWRAIRGKQLGIAFRRQVVIGGNFIADFAAPQVRLVVEVDGAYHAARVAADARRDRMLARLGYAVLHLDAKLLLGALPLAVEAVRGAVAKASLRQF